MTRWDIISQICEYLSPGAWIAKSIIKLKTVKYSPDEILRVDLLALVIMVYTPLIIPQAWMMWFAALGQSFLIGRRLK